jgi:GAF domain-containing protein
MSLSGAAGGTVDPVRLMQRVADQALELIPGADGVFIGLRDGDGIAYVCGAGHLARYVGTRIVIDGSLSGLAIQTGQALRSDDTRLDSRVDPESCRRLGVLSSVCVPVCRANERLGVVNVSSSEANSFSDDDVEPSERFAQEAPDRLVPFPRTDGPCSTPSGRGTRRETDNMTSHIAPFGRDLGQ